MNNVAVFRSRGTLADVFTGFSWPVDFFSSDDLPDFLSQIYVQEKRHLWTADGFFVQLWLAIEGELGLSIPGFEGVKLVIGAGDIEDLTFVTASLDVGEASALTLHDFRFALRFDKGILKPAQGDTGDLESEFVEIRVEGSVRVDSSFNVSVEGFNALSLTPSIIGDTGIVIAADDVKLDFSRTSAIPEVLAAGFDESFIGIYIENTKVSFPSDFPALAPEDLVLKRCAIGSGGVSGRLEAHYSPKYHATSKTFTGSGATIFLAFPSDSKTLIWNSNKIPS